MERSLRSSLCVTALLLLMCGAPAQAIPLFAQRYHLQCGACHSVLPELNSYGLYFRSHGYRLALPKHGTTGIAVRYQLEYEKDPAAGSRRYTEGGIILSNFDAGAVSAFLHYNLGAGGGPSGAYLAYLTTYNAKTNTTYRAGLVELPLAQSPGQRLDDLTQYGYYGTHVGLNDLTLASPRWGFQFDKGIGSATLSGIVDFGEFKGAAYGGKPLNTGEITGPATPEVGLFLRGPIVPHVELGAQALTGSRSISAAGRPAFTDDYYRHGVLAHFYAGKWDLQGEQWWGSDFNADGFGTRLASSGGYARLKFYARPHWYLGVRYDAAANPAVLRDWVFYTAFHITPHARLILQQVAVPGKAGTFGAAITVGAPWPPNL